MSQTRKLAAILCSDVVGYSRLAGADEDGILARLRASQRSERPDHHRSRLTLELPRRADFCLSLAIAGRQESAFLRTIGRFLGPFGWKGAYADGLSLGS